MTTSTHLTQQRKIMSNTATLPTKFGEATIRLSPFGNVSVNLDFADIDGTKVFQPFWARRSDRSSFAYRPAEAQADKEDFVTGKEVLTDAAGEKITFHVYASGKVTVNLPGPWNHTRTAYPHPHPHEPWKKRIVVRFEPHGRVGA